jgi:hypothetical protein
MNTCIARSQATTNRVVYPSIVNALNAHGVQVTAPGSEALPEELTLEARYLDSQGRPISNGSALIADGTNPVPNTVACISPDVSGRFTAMRVVVGDESTRTFGWLRWRNDAPGARSATTLARSLSGEGANPPAGAGAWRNRVSPHAPRLSPAGRATRYLLTIEPRNAPDL